MLQTASDPNIRFPDEIRVRAPRGLRKGVKLAAAKHNANPSEWSRQALLKSLEAEGIRVRDGQVNVIEG